MINFPVFESLDISGYGLYPGPSNPDKGLKIQFQPGLTLVLGANGLGKTTLVRILYRLLTGPFDIPRLEGRFDLGTTRLDAKKLSRKYQQTFGARVMDGARNATAILSLHLGNRKVLIERRLSNLALIRLEIDDSPVEAIDEITYQEKTIELVGTSSFGDWILLLRFLIFYFEDRRALVWDPAAQMQILRILLLSGTKAKLWTKDYREILELDSQMRNLQAVVGKEEKDLAKTETQVKDGDATLKKLNELIKLRDKETELYERLLDELQEVDKSRKQARQRVLKSEQEREAAFRGIERIKFASIGNQFPSSRETAKYIFAQLLTDQECIVCGNNVPGVEAEYANRIEKAQCVVCGSGRPGQESPLDAKDGKHSKNLQQSTIELRQIETDLEEARRALNEAEANFQSHENQINELREKIENQSNRIDLLIINLPPEEAKINKHRTRLDLMHVRVKELKDQLVYLREQFRIFVKKVNQEMAQSKEIIKTSFNKYAEGFLIEKCLLTWAPHKATVGQSGSSFRFPSFNLDMAGTDFPLPVRRTDPDQVSESQREFIDLAFRMALMSVASDRGSSLVMDAPESSLDAVFAPRAADVLTRFAKPKGNRLLITSNLVDGQLIPGLLNSIKIDDRKARLVNLLDIAEPTAAVRENREEYDKILLSLLQST